MCIRERVNCRRLRERRLRERRHLEVFVVAKDGIGMTINKHYKSLKFNPVMGGTQLAFKGGWSSGTAAIPSRHVSSHVFVLADARGGFGQLAFGRSSSTLEDRPKMRCIAGLQSALRTAAQSDALTDALCVAVGVAAVDAELVAVLASALLAALSLNHRFIKAGL